MVTGFRCCNATEMLDHRRTGNPTSQTPFWILTFAISKIEVHTDCRLLTNTRITNSPLQITFSQMTSHPASEHPASSSALFAASSVPSSFALGSCCRSTQHSRTGEGHRETRNCKSCYESANRGISITKSKLRTAESEEAAKEKYAYAEKAASTQSFTGQGG